jgi:hypothetical protein
MGEGYMVLRRLQAPTSGEEREARLQAYNSSRKGLLLDFKMPTRCHHGRDLTAVCLPCFDSFGVAVPAGTSVVEAAGEQKADNDYVIGIGEAAASDEPQATVPPPAGADGKVACRYCGKRYTTRGVSRHEQKCQEAVETGGEPDVTVALPPSGDSHYPTESPPVSPPHEAEAQAEKPKPSPERDHHASALRRAQFQYEILAFEREAEQAWLAAFDADHSEAAETSEGLARRDALHRLREQYATITDEYAEWAVRALLDAKIEVARVKAEQQILVQRAVVREKGLWYVLGPALDQYAKEAPRRSPTVVGFDTTTNKIQFVSIKESVKLVAPESGVRAELERSYTEDDLIMAGVYKVKVDLSKSGLTAFCLSKNTDLNGAVEIIQGHAKLTVREK